MCMVHPFGGRFPMTPPWHNKSSINPDHWDSLTVISPPSELVPPGLPASAVEKDSPEMGGRCYSIYSPKKRSSWLKIDGWKMNCHFLMVPFWGRGGVEKIIGILSVHNVFLCFECWFFVEFQMFFPFQADSKIFFSILFPSAATSILTLSSFDVFVHRYPSWFSIQFWNVSAIFSHLEIQLGDAPSSNPTWRCKISHPNAPETLVLLITDTFTCCHPGRV